MALWQSKKQAGDAASSDVQSILTASCTGHQPAKILLDDGLLETRFEAVAKDTVTFVLMQPTGTPVTPLSLCCVTFLSSERTCAFVGKVHKFAYPSLVLQLPTQISVAEGRVAYRVPITMDTGLKVRVKTQDAVVRDVEAIDISLAGMLIAVAKTKSSAIAIGAELDVELRLDDEIVRVSGIVRRQAGANQYGIFFPDCVVKGELRPPDDLLRMVNVLERTWLRNRDR